VVRKVSVSKLANAQRKYCSCRHPKRKAGFLQRRLEIRRDLSPNCHVHLSESLSQRNTSYLEDPDELALSWGAQVVVGQKLVHTANLTPSSGLGHELCAPQLPR